MPEPSGPVVLHIKQVGLVHGVDREGRSHAIALITTLSVAAHVCECPAARCSPSFVVEVIVVGDLGRVLPVCETGSLQVIYLSVQLLLASLQLLQLLQAFPRCVVDNHLLVL